VHVRETLAVSERRACRVLGQVRRTQRYTLKVTDDETILTESIVSLASEYGRYGYRRITALLRRDGWRVNHKRVERIWRQEGLKVPSRQPKRGRLWFNDGSCMEFIARAVRSWLSRLGVQTLFIERGSPWENGYVEDFNGKLRDELLNSEIFTTVHEA
tara:strand:- start:49 stop:522 length:474 start_codon:yes stop_codon:yes gene_type:complete